jgi:hypothetical protein
MYLSRGEVAAAASLVKGLNTVPRPNTAAVRNFRLSIMVFAELS